MSAHYLLGITLDTPKHEIDRIYRSLAVRLHPDRSSSANATVEFQNLANTYQKALTGQVQIYDVNVTEQELEYGLLRLIQYTVPEPCWFCLGRGSCPSHQQLRLIEEVIDIPRHSWPGRIINGSWSQYRLNIIAPPMVRYRGYDKVVSVPLTLFESLLGFNSDVDVVHIEIDHPIHDQYQVKFDNLGLYRPTGERGSLIIKFRVIFPTQLSPRQKSLILRLQNG